MPTQLYLTNIAAPYEPATLRGAWDDTAAVVTQALQPVPEGTLATVSRAETDTTGAWDVLLYRGVSGPLSAQTLSGTFDVMIGVGESSSLANFAWHVHIYVTQGDSDTPRGTLLSDYVETTANEWPSTAGRLGHALASAQTLSSLGVSAGDRLVVELGYLSLNTDATSRTGRIGYGSARWNPDMTSGADHSLGYCSFVTFSMTIGFEADPGRVSQLLVQAASPALVPARVSQILVQAASTYVPDLYVSVTVGAVNVSAYIIKHTIEIQELLVGSTASMSIKGSTGFPFFADALYGRPISISVSSPGGTIRIFAGHILSATQVNREMEVTLPIYALRCVDYSWQLDWLSVQASEWTQTPAEQIVEEMVAEFASAFTVDAALGGIIVPPAVGPTFPERLTFSAVLPRVGYTWTNGQVTASEIGGTMATGSVGINVTGVQTVGGVDYESDVSNPAGVPLAGGGGVRVQWDRPTGGEVYQYYRIYFNRTNGGHGFHPYDDDISGTPSARYVTHDNSTFDGTSRDFQIDIDADTDGTDYLDLSTESVDGLIDFESNSDETPTTFLNRLMALVGGYWWLDYDRVIHCRLLTAEPDGTQPDALDSTNDEYRLFTFQRDVSQVRTRVRCIGASTTTTTDTAVAATSIAVADLSIFGASGGLALVGTNRITYTGRSATSGAGNLTGVSGVDYAVDDGGNAQVLAEQSDTYAASVIANLSGGTGIIEQVISDGSADDAKARQLAQADLVLNATPDATITFETYDPLAVPGRTVYVDLTIAETGEEIADAFTIQSVHIDHVGFSPALYPRRRVTAGRSRQDLYALLKPLAALAPR